MDMFIAAKNNTSQSMCREARFGEEIAEHLSLIQSDYARETTKKQIRDVIFYAMYPHTVVPSIQHSLTTMNSFDPATQHFAAQTMHPHRPSTSALLHPSSDQHSDKHY